MRVLRILASRRLECGCLLGLYETYDGPTAGIIDDRDPSCADPSHRLGGVVEHTADATGPSALERAHRTPVL